MNTQSQVQIQMGHDNYNEESKNYENDEVLLLKFENPKEFENPFPHKDPENKTNGYPTMDHAFNQIGYTNFHYLMILSASLFFFSEGMQLYSFNLLIPMMQKLLNLTNLEHIIINSSIYFGYAFGSLLVGTLTKNFDRRGPLIFFLSTYAFFTVFVIALPNYYYITICRFIIGICIGAVSTLYLSGVTEFLPVIYREIMIAIIVANYCFGILIYVITFKYLNPEFDVEKWKITLMIISVPCIISWIMAIFVFRDSPRLHLNKNRFDDAVYEIRNLCKYSNHQFTSENEQELKRELEISQSKHIEFSFTMLFSKKYCSLTLINLFLMMTTSMVYVSNFFSLPLILYKTMKNHTDIFNEIILAQSFAVPAIILAALISGIPELGRKYTITSGILLGLGVAIYTALFQKGILIACSMINFFIMISYFLSKLYLIESFPSKLRDHGMSIVFVLTRIGESISPSICESWFRYYEFGPMIFISALLLIGLIFALLIPFETRGENLDSKI